MYAPKPDIFVPDTQKYPFSWLIHLRYVTKKSLKNKEKTLDYIGRVMVTITKKDLMKLGYGPSFSTDIIREAKKLMISKGHTYYQSKKLDRVPKEAVEELLRIKLPEK